MSNNLSITPNNYTQTLHVSQYDTEREIVINLTNGQDPYIPADGATAVIQGTKPSGLGFTVEGTISSSQVTFSTTEEMTDEPGRIACEVVLTDGTQRLGSANAILDVEPSPHPDGTTDGTAESVVSEITAIMQEAQAAAEAAAESAAEIKSMEVGAETLPAGSDATAAYSDGVLTFGIPQGDKGDKGDPGDDDAHISTLVDWEDGGFDTTGAIYADTNDNTARARTTAAYPGVTSIDGSATTTTDCYVKTYDANGAALSIQTIRLTSTTQTYELTQSGAVYTRISAIVTGTAGIETNGIVIKLNQNLAAASGKAAEAAMDAKQAIPAPGPYVIGAVNQVSRLGWKPTSGGYPPIQSLAGYAMAYDNKCRMMLADVRVTADGEYVCWHDETLSSSQIMHADGTALTAEEKAQAIADLTLAELDVYDFGIYKGSQYAGTKILRLTDFLRWTAEQGCWALLEMKVRWTAAQIEELATLIKRARMQTQTLLGCYYTDLYATIDTEQSMTYWMQFLPKTPMLVLSAQAFWTRALSIAQTFARAGIKTYVGHTKPAELTDEMIDTCADDDIGFFLPTDLTTTAAVEEYYTNGYLQKYQLINNAWVNLTDYYYSKR